MLPSQGTHVVTAPERAVYESRNGVLVFAARCVTEDGKSIIGYQTLVRADGTVVEKAVATMREIFGWDGRDPMWLQESDLGGIQFEAVVEPDEDQHGNPTVKVSWMNPLGGGGRGLQKGDRNAILSKYGAKFRAIAGTAPAPARPRPPFQRPAVAPAGAGDVAAASMASAGVAALPGQVAVPVAPPTRPGPAGAGGPTREDAWRAFCSAPQVPSDPESRAAAWWRAIDEVGKGRAEEEFTAEDWARLIECLEMPM